MFTNNSNLSRDNRILAILSRFSPCSSQWIPMMWSRKSEVLTAVEESQWSHLLASLDHLLSCPPCPLDSRALGIFQIPNHVMLVPFKNPALIAVTSFQPHLRATSSKRLSWPSSQKGDPSCSHVPNHHLFVFFLALSTPWNDLAYLFT